MFILPSPHVHIQKNIHNLLCSCFLISLSVTLKLICIINRSQGYVLWASFGLLQINSNITDNMYCIFVNAYIGFYVFRQSETSCRLICCSVAIFFLCKSLLVRLHLSRCQHGIFRVGARVCYRNFKTWNVLSKRGDRHSTNSALQVTICVSNYYPCV